MMHARKVIIKNLKSVKELEFTLPERSGVYLLTGNNGSGKTTLLVTLLRIGYPYAFADYFRTRKSDAGSSGLELDALDGQIIYQVGDEKVSYQHKNIRWSCKPKKSIFDKFGYRKVRLLAALGNRFFVQNDEIRRTELQDVPESIKNQMNIIFETSKWSKLKYVLTGTRKGPVTRESKAFVLEEDGNYFSERNFSLGESLVLNTLQLIEGLPEESLLLIDEVEMALHPKAQIKLYEHILAKSRLKKLTVILATHSSSLIKTASFIYYLERSHRTGVVTVHDRCYPAHVLGQVALIDDNLCDYVFLVEDNMGRFLLEEMYKHYLAFRRLSCIIKFLPIGGIVQILNFADNAKDYVFPRKTSIFIFFDQDVEASRNDLLSKRAKDLTEAAKKNTRLYKDFQEQTFFLPITPEKGLCTWIYQKPEVMDQAFRENFSAGNLRSSDYIGHIAVPSGDKETNWFKSKFRDFLNETKRRTNVNEERIIQAICKAYVQDFYSTEENMNELKRIFGKIFNTRV